MESKKRARDGQDADSGQEGSVIDSVMFPGDLLSLEPLRQAKATVRVGFGLVHSADSLKATQPGTLRLNKRNNRLWIESSQRRYVPCVDDFVIGMVKGSKMGEYYRVDVNATREALLPYLAFDGATKRNRPNLVNGALVYARVVSADRDMNPEITCAASTAKAAKDWVTGESVFGELKKGLVVKVTQKYARKLLNADSCRFLTEIGSKIPFEIAVGFNGKVWVRSENVPAIVYIADCIRLCEFVDDIEQTLFAAARTIEAVQNFKLD